MSSFKNSAHRSFSSLELRNALGSFATGVTIVTALGREGQKVGMTANSFNSVSLEPALVLWSIGRTTNCFDEFIAAQSFAIHVLAEDQQPLSNLFAMTGTDRFAELDCTEGLAGVPILPHYSSCFQCTIEHQYDGGDHVIIVGRVIELHDSGHKPLLFHRGDYANL
jgi:3-hydroxy-9,10-secoandrosta-1,3,5(10)-triene-9,17-dione monooxygenase reductase component